jgi:allantoin racemase
MHLAAVLGHRFSVLTLFDHDIPSVEDQAARYGLSAKLASARAFNIPVLALADDLEATVRVLVEVGERAVRDDGAHVLIPGCTGLAGLAPRIQAGLAERGCEVPVLDPPPVALKLAESLVALGLAHSKRTFPSPRAKAMRWPVTSPLVAATAKSSLRAPQGRGNLPTRRRRLLRSARNDGHETMQQPGLAASRGLPAQGDEGQAPFDPQGERRS